MASKFIVVLKCFIGLVLCVLLAGLITFVVVQYWQRQKNLVPTPEDSRPNIIIFMADDLGWDDVSFHGNDQIPTPNLDAFASHGVILNSLYSAGICTPSRGSLLTGKLPLHIGLQEYDILSGVYGSGLPLNHKIMPEYFRDLGYETHLIGKWHLGFYKESLLPTNRGFDTHYGSYSGSSSYYSHNSFEKFVEPDITVSGYDFHLNGKPDFTAYGNYVTDLYDRRFEQLVKEKSKKPLFIILSHLAPHGNEPGDLLQTLPTSKQDYNNEQDSFFDHIRHEQRRKYADLVKTIDDSFGKMVEVLSQNELLENSVIFFLSDNGGPSFNLPRHNTGASNWPFRGSKIGPWQGGLRVSSFVWSSALKETAYVNSKLYHFVDVLPTLYGLVGNISDLDGIDGKDVWESITNKTVPSPRDSVLLVYDRESTFDYGGYAAIIGRYKLVSGKWNGFENSNYYLAAGERLNSVEELERRRVQSKAHNVLVQRGYIKDIPENWRDEAVVKCFWGKHLKCNGVRCKDLMKSPTGNDYLEVEVIPVKDTYVCDFTHEPCVFDLDEDPCETINIAKIKPEILQDLISFVNSFESVEPVSSSFFVHCFDPNANPFREDPPVWKPWANVTCDDLLHEPCAQKFVREDKDICPRARRIQ